MPKELTIYTGTIHKFAIISNHDQRSIEPSIDQSSALGMARCDNAPGKNRQVPGDAYCCCCLLLSVVSTLDSVRLVIGRQKCAVAYWKLIGNNMASSGCASSLFVVVVPCCCLLLLVVVVVLHQCCNEQCLHYKAQCVNAMHACACPDTVQTLRLPDRQTEHARTQPLTHATRGVEEEGEGAQTTAI